MYYMIILGMNITVKMVHFVLMQVRYDASFEVMINKGYMLTGNWLYGVVRISFIT